ncbi:tyrosine-type recombinase/integrase [Furfurilactobacillus rossiae]|nr:site-specific integrase [Furfurilactobacillus rossiae]QFR66473.1 tyrosine-type recombinase/integrase [Furfurilactobacillus rossiae]QLE61934.1 Phage integrase [Furfurilactobacillus rossiae]
MEWYEIFEEPKLAPATKKWYMNSAKIIKKYFGKEPMTHISRARYQRFLNDFGKTHAIKSASKVDSHIKMAVRSAVDDGLIPSNFTAHTSMSGHAGKSAEEKYIDGASMWRLIKRCEQTPDIHHISQVMILTALFTGFRIAEVAGLQWQDLDQINNTLSVTKTYDWTTGGFKPTKNAQSKRTIAVVQELVDNLNKLHASQTNIDNPNNLMFIGENPKVPSSNGANHVLRELLTELDIHPTITFHGLRHTHASYLLANDVSIYEISERLGHKDYTTTLKIYSHMQKEMKLRETKKGLQAFQSRTRFVHGFEKRLRNPLIPAFL